jgi:hypothetical protein
VKPTPYPCGGFIRPEGHHEHAWAELTRDTMITVEHSGPVRDHESMRSDQFKRDCNNDGKAVQSDLCFVDSIVWCGDCGLVAETQTTRTTTATSVLFQQETTYRVVGPEPDAGKWAKPRSVCPPCTKKEKS